MPPALAPGYRGHQAPAMSLRLPPDDLARIDALAEMIGAKRSEVVRRLIAAGMAAHADPAGVLSAA